MLDPAQTAFIKNNFARGRVVCLTGAGISFESGIPTFRGKGGLWEKFDPDTYAYIEGLTSVFRKDPAKAVDFIADFYGALLESEPNPAHLSLAILEKESILKAIITQNVDSLHQRAGNRSVIELHGNAFRIKCRDCGNSISLERDRIREMVRLFEKNRHSRTRLLRIMSRYCPRCSKCSGRFRIDIVFFGEMLPQDGLAAAYSMLSDCSVLMVIGSSLVVYPAASLPLYAKEKGAKIIEINQEPSAFSDICDFSIRAKAGDVLPEIVQALGFS